ncbi:AbrB family transcriptional regulator, partial [Pseudomonas aeruginosa]|uniref:AbrB family transcriptional regulator n=1 Tax=Pseudomonas aeruginosa TaxID=287 RepID=UPI00209428C6
NDLYHAASVPLQPLGLLGLLAAGLVAGGIAARLGIPNGWLFGPLVVSAALTASGHALSSVPAWMVKLGQWLIGCSLGARFTPEFFRGTPRFLLGVLVSGGALFVLCMATGVLIALLAGIPWPTMVLATAPGGIAEMVMTAKLLQLGVPL